MRVAILHRHTMNFDRGTLFGRVRRIGLIAAGFCLLGTEARSNLPQAAPQLPVPFIYALIGLHYGLHRVSIL